jgi:DNA end-binding protein Ku
MRAIRKTYLSCGLLNAPIKIYAAVSDDKEIKFSLVGPFGEKVEQVYIPREEEDDRIWEMQEGEKTGKRTVRVLDYQRMGYAWNDTPISKGQIAKVEAAVTTEDMENIVIERFVKLNTIPWERGQKLYFLGPDKEVSGKSFETFKAALKKKKVAGIAKIVVKKRQMLLAVFEQDGQVLALRLHFAAQMREGDPKFLTDDKVKVNPKEVAAMGDLIDAYMTDPEEIDTMEDTYVDAKITLVEDILAGKVMAETPEKEPEETKESNLMAELEASVKDAKKAKRKGKVKA